MAQEESSGYSEYMMSQSVGFGSVTEDLHRLMDPSAPYRSSISSNPSKSG